MTAMAGAGRATPDTRRPIRTGAPATTASPTTAMAAIGRARRATRRSTPSNVSRRDRPRASGARPTRLRQGRARRGHTASDAPPRVLPVRVAQPPLEDLARLLARQRLGEFHHARHLVVG